MRLPSGRFSDYDLAELGATNFLTVGCVSFEERCTALPLRMWTRYGQGVEFQFFELADPPDGVPDYSNERQAKVKANKHMLEDAGFILSKKNLAPGILLASEQQLLKECEHILAKGRDTIVLDISTLPKRHFCFLLRQLISSGQVKNLIVTYTEAGAAGYTSDHLAADVMTPEPFPGFGGKFSSGGDNLVVAVGFEALGLRKLILDLYREVTRDLRIILPFPAPIDTVRRQWNTLAEIMEHDPENLRRENVAVIAAWDSEYVYKTLSSWASLGTSLSLAPFGPKPHTLAMALFAIKHDASIWYTQPKVYHPDYSRGVGDTWWYVVKWQGIACFDRK